MELKKKHDISKRLSFNSKYSHKTSCIDVKISFFPAPILLLNAIETFVPIAVFKLVSFY